MISSVILFFEPLITRGDSVSGCPAGTVRTATASDVTQFLTVTGRTITEGTCLTQSDVSQLDLNGTASQAIQDLSQNFICPGRQPGYNASVSAAVLKENYVYFSANGVAINSKFIVCVDNFLKAAKQAGYNPCLTAALRTAAGQVASCLDPSNSIVCGKGDCNDSARINACPHVKGIAVDVNPQPNTSQNVAAMHAMASKYGVGYTVPGDLPHIQPVSAACNGSGSTEPISNAAAPLQKIAQTLGLATQQCQAGYTLVNGTCTPQYSYSYTSPSNSAPAAGQVVNQDTLCVISTNPPMVETITAGSVYPAGCINTGAQTSATCNTQTYCSGNTVMNESSSCSVTAGQTCPYGCSNGACSQQTSQSTNSGSTGTSGSGSTGTSGSTGSTNTGTSGTTATTNTGSTGTTGTTGTANTGSTQTTSSITSPTLVPNLLTPSSTAEILRELANPSSSNTAATTSTTTPIILNSSVANNISQMQPASPAGVTYAQPASAYFNTQNSQQNNQAGGGTTPTGGGYSGTAGTGYADSSSSASATSAVGPAGTNISLTHPTVDTFTDSPQSETTGTVSSFEAASTFNSSLAVLNVLKTEVLGALNFLSTYAKPFGGNIPSQMVE